MQTRNCRRRAATIKVVNDKGSKMRWEGFTLHGFEFECVWHKTNEATEVLD